MSAREELFGFVAAGAEEADLPTFAAALDAYRAEVLAEAKVETVAWLVKKAREQAMQNAGVLASKLDRGAVRAFLGTAHFRDAMDAHRAEVLREAAEALEARVADVDVDPRTTWAGMDAAYLRAMADEVTTGGAS